MADSTIYRDGEAFVELAAVRRRLGLTELQVRHLVAHGHIGFHSANGTLYLREFDVSRLERRSEEDLAKLLPPTDPAKLAADVRRL
jgi:hypothetical protein